MFLMLAITIRLCVNNQESDTTGNTHTHTYTHIGHGMANLKYCRSNTRIAAVSFSFAELLSTLFTELVCDAKMRTTKSRKDKIEGTVLGCCALSFAASIFFPT